jgi:hypothetical protein
LKEGLLAVDEGFYFRFIAGEVSTSGWNSVKESRKSCSAGEKTRTTKASNNSTMTHCSSREAD